MIVRALLFMRDRLVPAVRAARFDYRHKHPPFCSAGLLRSRHPDLPSTRSELWRDLSWNAGDDVANDVCKVVDVYCYLVGLDPARLAHAPPGGH